MQDNYRNEPVNNVNAIPFIQNSGVAQMIFFLSATVEKWKYNPYQQQ